jgi:hypothetical protein
MEPPPMTAASHPAKTPTGKTGPSRAGTIAVSRRNGGAGAWETITFGDVTITAQRPSEADIQRNVEASTRALQRALPRLLRPGVRIYAKKDVPLYWADEENPDEGMIRKLNGKVQRGVMDEDGRFKATD